MNDDQLTKILILEEGFSEIPYKDSKGIWTIGVGWNIEEHGLPAYAAAEYFTEGEISEESAKKMLGLAMITAKYDARTFLGNSRPGGLTPARERAIQNMAFQLGAARLLGFKKTRHFIQEGNWYSAASECLDSKWARQDSPQRAERVSKALATGEDAFYFSQT